MNLQFDADLIEQAVFLEMRRRENLGAQKLVRDFRKQLDALYEQPPSDARETAFFNLNLRYFKQLGFEKFLLSLLEERPLITQKIQIALFRKVRGKNEEGAELFVKSVAALLRSADSEQDDPALHPAGRDAATPIQNPKSKIQNLSVSLRPERFQSIPALKTFLRHELLHISDMLDPAFDYTPHVRLPDRPIAEENLLRDRYRILWDITIDGRLAREFPNAQLAAEETSSESENAQPANGVTCAACAERRSIASEPQSGHDGACPSTEQTRLTEFNRAFIFLPDGDRVALFDQLWNGDRPTHPRLVEITNRARELAPQHADLSTPPQGAHCPLCKFPTFNWAHPAIFTDDLRLAIVKDFPRWSPEQGACERCTEVYQAAKHPLPATLYL